jgi:serine/threonine protein kinase
MSDQPRTDEPTVLANRYRLERRLGQGGMSEVWLATDLALDRRVAVKWLKPTLATDVIVAERFRREAIAVARLNHPNIVAVHDAFEHEGRQAVVMQLVDGKSLRQILDVQTRLSPELTIHIGSCVAAALDAAHRAGFVHRDVKPGNILLTPDGRVLLTDFGIAKGLDSGDDDLTSDNVMMGTAKYLSPEQVRGKRLDGRADLYSLGLVLYECLAGRVPFLGETDADTALARLQRDPTDLGQLRPTLPRGLVTLIHRLLSRNPNHRPRTGSDLRNELAVVASEAPPSLDTTPADPVPRFESKVRPVPPGTAPSRAAPGEQMTAGRSATGVASTERTEHGRDTTPRASAPMRGRPARSMQQTYKPSLIVVGGLLLIALVVAILLWVMAGTDDDPQSSTADTSVAANTRGERDPASATTVAAGQASIAGLSAVHFNGRTGTTDEQTAAAEADNDPATVWPTECYADRFLGGVPVGLRVDLDRASTGTLTFDVLSNPYQVNVYAVRGATPTSRDEWGQPIGGTRTSIDGRQQVSVRIDAAPARHMLIEFIELGQDPGCSGANPYRGLLGDVTFSS